VLTLFLWLAVKMRWQLLDVKGDLPCPRHSHAAVAVRNRMFVFGGTDGKQLLNDVHIFDSATSTWSKPEVSGSITPRVHTAVDVVGHLIIFFGGQGPNGNDLNDTVALDTGALCCAALRCVALRHRSCVGCSMAA
jgi:hypothetical protein